MNALVVTGEVAEPLRVTAEQMAEFPERYQAPDTRALGADRAGTGVYLNALVNMAVPEDSVKYVTFRSPSDDFAASVPLDRVKENGVVIYAINGKPIPREKGGPFRFIIPNAAACQSDEIDECVNVKFLEEIVLSEEKLRDTRPKDEEEHAKLHGK